jgi:hypothetical protein
MLGRPEGPHLMARPEHQLQMAAWVYAQQVLPPEADFASVETKTGRDDRVAAMHRKAAGIRSGQPDCQITYKGRVTYVELKAGSSVSDAQHKRHAELRRAGAEVYVIRTIASLRQIFLGLGVQLRHHALTAEMRDEMLAARRAAPKPPARKRAARVTRRTAEWQLP